MATSFIVYMEDGKLVVNMGPNVNWTPFGAVQVPVAYSAVAFLDSGQDTTGTVNVNDQQAYVLGRSFISLTMGGEAGSGGGLVSDTIDKDSWPSESSSTVMFEGKPVIREQDFWHMNGTVA